MINNFNENNLEYFKKYFKYWFLILGLMMAGNLVILLFDPSSTANNQDLINEMFMKYPFYTFIISVFLAPVIEELVFRLCFYKLFTTKYLFIFLSGFIFGSFHVIGSYSSPIDLLYIIPYSIPGFVFAYLMQKTDNICVSTFLHFVHNGVVMSLQVLILLFA